MGSERGLAVALVLAVVLLGGGGLWASSVADDPTESVSTASPDTSDGPAYTVGFDPPYDADRVLRRVERLRGLNATGTVRISTYRSAREYRNDDRSREVSNELFFVDPPGARALLVHSNATIEPGEPLGYVEPEDDTASVHLLARSDLARFDITQEAVLAHEYVHALQYQHGLADFDGIPGDAETTDAAYVSLALLEGDAALTQIRYQRRYGVAGFRATRYRAIRPGGGWPGELQRAAYYYGVRYFRTRNATAADRTAAFRHPPNTTRRLLHPAAPPTDRTVGPPPLSLTNRTTFTRLRTDRVGELAIRRALRLNGVSFRRASRAAEGWQDDDMAYYLSADGEVVAWHVAWTNASEAREFAATYRSVLSRRNATRAGSLRRLAGPTTPPAYYRLARDGATVTVVAGGNRTATARLAGAVIENSTASAG